MMPPWCGHTAEGSASCHTPRAMYQGTTLPIPCLSPGDPQWLSMEWKSNEVIAIYGMLCLP
jgi:hypothetical protein